MKLLEGKVVIVTGSGGGIGRDFAHAMAEHGARVVVNDIGASVSGEGRDAGPAQKVVDEIKAKGGTAVASTDSVSEWESANRIVKTAIDAFGRIDVVVNNAGILRDTSIVKMTEGDWDKVIAVHLKGTFNMTHHACVYWSEESKAGNPRRASIVNTVSSAGLQGNPGQANYGAAKAGIAALTVITALEGARYGVRANAIAPGGATRMVHETMPNIPLREANDVPDGEFERLNPGNSAPMVVWLASDESILVSGQVFRAVGADVTHYHGWSLGATASNQIKGEPAKWDPARLGTALAKDVFGLQPGGLKMAGKS